MEQPLECALTDARRAGAQVCVQGSMGQGVFQGLPLMLSGVRRILELMDWGDASEFIKIGRFPRSSVQETGAGSDPSLLSRPQVRLELPRWTTASSTSSLLRRTLLDPPSYPLSRRW